MPRWLGFGVLVLSLVMVQGCSSLRKATGLDKRSPDEFAVVKRAPLIVPPEFDLRPPVPGAGRPNVDTASQQARATLTGRSSEPGWTEPGESTTPAGFAHSAPVVPSSEGEQALLARTGTAATDPNIRRKISEEQAAPAPVDDALFTRLMDEPKSSDIAPTVVEQRQTPLDELGGSNP
jgi:hypothetical protein